MKRSNFFPALSGMLVVSALVLSLPHAAEAQSLEQEGFRFRYDDGSESAAAWVAAQDTDINRAQNLITRLRVLLNATGDPASTQYRLDYKKSTESNYFRVQSSPQTATPVIMSTATGATTATNVTSHAITMPAGIQAGDLLLILFSCDGAADAQITSGNWVKLDSDTNSTVVSGSLFYKFAEGSDTATVTTSATEQSSHIVYRISGASVPRSASANSSGTNSNPPNLDTLESKNYLWIATRSGDSTVVATAAPGGYTGLLTQAAAGTGGASSNAASTTSTASSEDPGTFTSNSEQWVSFTIGIPPYSRGIYSAGNRVGGTTSLSVPYPANIQAGDLLVMGISNKYLVATPASPSTPSGWTALADNQNNAGTGTDGTDNGDVYGTVFTRVADGTETGNVSVTITSGNSSVGGIVVVRNREGERWQTPVLANGTDTSVGTGWSVTAGSDPGVTAGDMVLVFSAVNTDARTYNSQAVTSSGVTYITGGEPEVFETGVTNGNDTELVATRFIALSGTSNAAPVYTMTANGTTAGQNPVGVSVFVRLRAESEPIILSTSSNIAASGENTTVQLSAPSGKTTGDFVAGRIQDDENPADAVNITTDDYTEMEWSLIATDTAQTGDKYQFRVTVGGTALNTYAVTPLWQIGTAVGRPRFLRFGTLLLLHGTLIIN